MPGRFRISIGTLPAKATPRHSTVSFMRRLLARGGITTRDGVAFNLRFWPAVTVIRPSQTFAARVSMLATDPSRVPCRRNRLGVTSRGGQPPAWRVRTPGPKRRRSGTEDRRRRSSFNPPRQGCGDADRQTLGGHFDQARRSHPRRARLTVDQRSSPRAENVRILGAHGDHLEIGPRPADHQVITKWLLLQDLAASPTRTRKSPSRGRVERQPARPC